MLERFKKNYFLLISSFLILYFFFNLLSGQRGLISFFEKKQNLNNLQNEELLLKSKINVLHIDGIIEQHMISVLIFSDIKFL